SESLRRQRFYVVLLALFATVATLMVVAGIYSVVTYAVTHRTRELGVRLALGAQRADVVGLVVGRVLALAVVGVILGLAGAFAGTRLLRGLLFQVQPADPLVLSSGAALLTLVALGASYLPVRRAARVDPVIALRVE